MSLVRPLEKLKAATGTSGWRLHDVRRSSRTLLSRAGISADVAERCLGHVIGGVRSVYDKHHFRPEMLNAFEALATQIDLIVNPRGCTVVPIKQKKGRANGEARASA
jgi:integrase